MARSFTRALACCAVALMGTLAASCTQAVGQDDGATGTATQAVLSAAGATGSSAHDGGADSSAPGSPATSRCHEIPNFLDLCSGSRPVKIGCSPGTTPPAGCQSSPEDYTNPGGVNRNGLATWCCPQGAMQGSTQTSTQTTTTLAGTCTGGCGEGKKCNCSGSLYLQQSSALVLTTPKLYVVWWGWTNQNDPEVGSWRDFLQNLGGSPWLETVTQYAGSNGFAGNPNDLWTDEWFDNTDPLPASDLPCQQNSDCTESGQCDLQTHTCMCKTDADCCPNASQCWTNRCNQTTGLCYPTSAELDAEVDKAASHFVLPGDAIVLVAMPPDINFPGFMAHGVGGPDMNYIQAGYYPDGTWLLDHEIAEAITDPWPSDQDAWRDPCGCEIGDMCNPPPSTSNIPQNILVGESPTEDHQVESLWSNFAYSGAGGCVMSMKNHAEHFFTACGGHLRHYTGAAGGSTEDLGYPGVLLDLDSGLSGAGAASWGYGRYDAFAVDQNGNVDHFYHNASGVQGWGGWGKPPNGYVVQSSPDAFAPRPQTLQVAVTAASGSTVHVFHKYYANGTYSGWLDWGAPPTAATIISRPAVASANAAAGDDQVHLWVVTSDYHVWHGYSDDGGATILGWTDYGTPPNDLPTIRLDAASWGDQELELLVVGWSGHVWEWRYDHGSEYWWIDRGLPPNSNAYFGVGAAGLGDTAFTLTAVPNSDPSNYLYDTSIGQWPWGTWLQGQSDVDVCSGVDIATW